jgi:hypothetical protein
VTRSPIGRWPLLAFLAAALFVVPASGDGVSGATGTLYDRCAVSTPGCGRILTFDAAESLPVAAGAAFYAAGGTSLSIAFDCVRVLSDEGIWRIFASGSSTTGSRMFLSVQADSGARGFGFSVTTAEGAGQCGSPSIVALDAEGAVFAQPVP